MQLGLEHCAQSGRVMLPSDASAAVLCQALAIPQREHAACDLEEHDIVILGRGVASQFPGEFIVA
jgi:hypothetical protein